MSAAAAINPISGRYQKCFFVVNILYVKRGFFAEPSINMDYFTDKWATEIAFS